MCGADNVCGIGTPVFSLGLTQQDNGGQSSDAVLGRSNHSERLGFGSGAHDCPESSNMKGSNKTSNTDVDDQSSQKIADLEQKVESLTKEIDANRTSFEETRKTNCELIEQLRAENSQLLKKIAVLEEGPTATQLYENQAVMDQLAASERIAIPEGEKRDMMSLIAELTKQAMKQKCFFSPDIHKQGLSVVKQMWSQPGVLKRRGTLLEEAVVEVKHHGCPLVVNLRI